MANVMDAMSTMQLFSSCQKRLTNTQVINTEGESVFPPPPNSCFDYPNVSST